AARDTGASAPTLGRRMRALERALGRELFVRRTHGYDLTAAGQRLRDELEPVAGRIDRIATPKADGRLPLVKLSAGTWTTRALVRRLPDVAGDPPDVRLRFVSSEALLSLARREVAIGIRNHRPTEPGLAGRKLAPVAFAAYATPGAPPGWIAVQGDTPSARWVRARAGADVQHEANHPRVALDLALAGAGWIVLPTFVGDWEAGLTRTSAPIGELAHDAWLILHDDDRHLPEIRRVADRVTRVLS
ncbi:MAG: LysR family transcriptional regulator, partial [Pseudomonadota bacterium]